MLNIFPEHTPLIGLVVSKMKSPFIAQLIVAIIVGAITLFGTVNVLGTKIDFMSAQLNTIGSVLIRQDNRLRIVERETAINTQSILDSSRKE